MVHSKSKIKSGSLEVINKMSAGIDLGSKSHWVCYPETKTSKARVQEFRTDTQSLLELVQSLRKAGVNSVAMESTGVYWIPLFEILTESEIEVILADTRILSRVPGRKTDMLDCQWIQQLHSYGLLHGAFRPGDSIVKFRALARMKKTLVSERSDWLRRMQKELDQMNIRVHHAVSDISGVTGMAILNAIVDGERDPSTLAGYRDRHCRKSKEEIEKELTGNWRQEHLINLGIGLKTYNFLSAQIEDLESKICELLEELALSLGKSEVTAPELPKKSKAKTIIRYGHEKMRQCLFKISGVDLTRIDGVSADMAEIILSEIGPDLSMFSTEKQFISYLRLAPNLAISGGKKIHGKKKKIVCCSRVKSALCMAAVTLWSSKTAIGAYYRNVSYKKGASVAVFATARKIAQYIYRMLKYGSDYVDIGIEAYEERNIRKRIRNLQVNAKNLGFMVAPIQTVF